MAINQQPFTQSVSLPAQNISTGQGFTQLANATSAVSNLLTDKINEVAITQAAQQGEADVQSERQPDKLALPFTKATRAYNNAVSNTEARRMAASADELIAQSLANNKNPATFDRSTPAKFHAELEGIKSGILEHARDENREAIREHLDKKLAQASISMLQHSITFDNQQTMADAQQDISRLLEARRNAVVEGDQAVIQGLDDALKQSVADYSTMNAQFARAAPYLQADIEKHKAIDTVIGGYAEALHNKTTGQFLKNLAENKEKIPFNVWNDAVKAVVALDQTEKRLKNDTVALQLAQVDYGIESGAIQDPADILNYTDIPLPQQLAKMKQLEAKQATEMRQGSQLITAQQNIINGVPEINSPDTRNKMFKSQLDAKQKATGQPATLAEMGRMVQGQSDYPASGLPETPMGTNVPAFDAIIQGKLTSKNPMMTAEAAMVFNDMVEVQGQPNSVHLTGDALAVASLFNTLNKGDTTAEEAANLAINTVMNAKDPEIAQRIERFNKTIAKTNPQTGQQDVLRGKFKDAFGLSPQAFGSDEAFKVFKDSYLANYVLSNSDESAFSSTKYLMRSWGTDKHFDHGYVGNPTTKESPISNIANAFDNQLVSNVQGYINRTKAAREAHPDLNIPVVEWADEKQTINFNESEQDKVFKKMTIGNHPKLKINGVETDVVLMPSATSRLDNKLNWILGVYDQFNNLHPLKDVTNRADQVARFAPQELSKWAPGVATAQTDELIKSYALKVRQKEIEGADKELKELEKKTPAWQVIFGVAKPDEYLQYIATRNDNSNEGRLNQIIDSLKGASAQKTRREITDADNTGVSMDLEPKK